MHTKEEIKGYGIGLKMCKRIIELLDRTIRVELEIEKGSKFYFTFKKFYSPTSIR
ncbi:MAG: ATP-binding protein [Rickettsiales endosymbiont of Dermacentor nuttalli]